MITTSLITATAEAYTEEQLQQKLQSALSELLEIEGWISSASSGGGTSYQRQRHLALTEKIDLLKAALDYKRGDSSAASLSHFTPIVINPLP